MCIRDRSYTVPLTIHFLKPNRNGSLIVVTQITNRLLSTNVRSIISATMTRNLDIALIITIPSLYAVERH